MRASTEVNADANKVAFMDTRTMEWSDTEWQGIQRKVLEFVNHAKMGRETSILKFLPGASLPTTSWDERLDFFVIDGSCSDEHGTMASTPLFANLLAPGIPCAASLAAPYMRSGEYQSKMIRPAS